MSLKADVLKESNAQRLSIRKEINTLLKLIDADLKSGHDLGRYSIRVSLPILFAIPNMTNTTAQVKIYSHIMKSLEQRGFYVELDISNKDKRYLDITWISNQEKKELEEQMNYIAKRTKKIHLETDDDL
jgi:hypothetical protein